MIVSKKGTSGTAQDGFLFGINDMGKVALELEGTTFTPGFGPGPGPGVTAKDLRDGACHHIAWIREVGGATDTVMAYQDGDMVKKTRKTAGTHDVSTTDDLWIGWSEDFTTPGLYQWRGDIKEVRIWNYARTEAQIEGDMFKHLVGNESGLIAYWRLNEDFGQTVYDCGPNQLNGLIKNGGKWENFICDNMNAIPGHCVNGPPLDVEEVNMENDFYIYPNPAVNSINVRNNSASEIDRVFIVDMQGRLVMSEKWDGHASLDLSKLGAGSYVIVLKGIDKILFRDMLMLK